MSDLPILIVNHTDFRVPKKYLFEGYQWTLAHLPKRCVMKAKRPLTIVFLKRSAARKINKEFRNKNYATDVLSFDGGRQELGELILCPEVLKRQAKEHGLTFQQEVFYMVLHGMLHLLGYDHESSDKKAHVMFTLQDSIFNSFIDFQARRHFE